MENILVVFSFLFDFFITYIENYLIIRTLELFFLKKHNFTLLCSILFTVISTIINSIFYPPIFCFILLLLLLYIYVFLFLEGDCKLKAIIPILIFANIFIINTSTIFMLLIFNFNPKDFISTLSVEYFFIALFQKSILLLEYLYLSKYKKHNLYISNNTWIWVVLLLLLSIIFPQLVLTNYIIGTLNNNIILFMSLLQFFIINLFIYIILNQLNKEHNNILKQQILLETNKHEQKINSMIESKIDEMNRLNHDINNHKIIIKNLIKTNNNNDVKNYVDKIFSNDMSYVFTDNQILNYILNEKINIAKKYGIDVKCMVQGNLKKTILITDLTIIIGNLLDNAIEATIQTENKQIKINIIQDEYKLIISVSNSFNGKLEHKDSFFKSSKIDKDVHGYGLSNIKLTCNKYNGDSFIKYDSNFFYHTCTFLLKNNQSN